MNHRLAAVAAALLLLPAVWVPVQAAGPQIHNAAGLTYGDTVTLDTDATTGTVTLYKPSTTGTGCWSQVLSIPAPYDGQIRGVELERAGLWRLDHRQGASTESTTFTVAPQPLRILATATPNPDGSHDYTVQVAKDATQVPYAYLDVYYGEALVRHLRTDGAGQANIYSTMLPYAGVYRLVAYRDLETPAFTYSNAFVPQDPPPCDGTYNAPEQYRVGAEVGSGFSAVAKDTVPFGLRVTEGPIQVRHILSTSTIQVQTPAGEPILPSDVHVLVNGLEVSPASIGLGMGVSVGEVVLTGTWDAAGDVAVSLLADSNADGIPEYSGVAQIQVRRDLPLRFVPVLADGSPDPDPRLAYRVPPPNSDGTPGRQVLRFKLYDLDNHEGRPPTPGTVAITGDLLPGASVAYDSAKGYWIATATPLNSDSDYRLSVDWPSVGKVTVVVDMPRDGGARTSQEFPDGHLTVAKRSDAIVRVQRFNPAAISHQACTPLPNCAYENVTDAHVRLAWADTGLPVLDPAGRPYEYYPGRAPGACSCYEYQGGYRFQNLALNRSGTLLAIATINVPGPAGTHAYSYMPFAVDPEPVYTPTINPSRTLAGAFTRYSLTSAGLSPATLDQFDIRLVDASGRDVANPANLTTLGAQVFFSAVLPAGSYSLVIQDRLDPFATPPQLGKKGTLSPGTLRVLPADLRFAYTDAPLHPNTLGVDLRTPLDSTYVLGGSLGKVVQLRMDVFGTDGKRVPGTIRLEGFHNAAGVAHAFALLAYSDQNQPTTGGAPRLYAPDDAELAWMCDNPGIPDPDLADCGSYYFAELPAPDFAMALDLAYNAQPILIYVFGVGVGDVRVSFLPAGSNLNREQPAPSTIHVIPPSADATEVTTHLGTTVDQSLVVGIANLVALQAWDATGYNELEGLGLELRRTLYGPSQVPGGILHYASGASYADVHVAVVPDATGPLSAYVVQGEAIVDTRVRVFAKGVSQVEFNTTAVRVFVDLAAAADEAAVLPIRVGTSADPFPQGATVQAFGRTIPLVSGSGNLVAPFVDGDQDLPIVIEVPGLVPVIRSVHIRDLANQVRSMQVTDVPATIKEGQAFTLTVRDGNRPLAAVEVQFLGMNATTDLAGQATLQAPLVTKTTDAWLTLAKQNYTVLQKLVQVIDTGRPQLVFEVQRAMEGGSKYTVTVRAVSERGDPAPAPASLTATIEAQRASGLQFNGRDGASWSYEAPRLVEHTRIYAFAHADGYESAMTIITIRGAST